MPNWYGMEAIAHDLQECIIPETKLERNDGGYRLYKLLWGDIELKENESLKEFVEAHGIPIDEGPVVLKVFVGYRPAW